MGLDSFVHSAKKFVAAPKRSVSSQSLEARTVTIIDADAKANPNVNLPVFAGSWKECKHLLSNPAKQLCKKFGCNCKEDTCPPKFRL